jgi:FkbM family methyltransferase
LATSDSSGQRFKTTQIQLELIPGDSGRKFIDEYVPMLKFQRAVEDDNRVYDFGAYKGVYSIIAASEYDVEAFAFEIDEENRRIMNEMINLNRPLEGSIEVKPIAVGGENGKIEFEKGKGEENQIGKGQSYIECQTPRKIFEEYGDPDIVKMDIEGAEFSAMKNSVSDFKEIEKKLIEIHKNRYLENFSHSVEQMENLVDKVSYEKQILKENQLSKIIWCSN